MDVGLVDSAGRELPMPSAFDEFSERSHLDFASSSPDKLVNRQVLPKHHASGRFFTGDYGVVAF